MTIQNFIPLVVVPGTGNALSVAVPSPFYSADQIKVYLVDHSALSAETLLTAGVDYILTTAKIAGSSPAMLTGSILTFGSVSASADIAVLINTADEQTSNIGEVPFNAALYEKIFDLSAMRDARQDELIKRAPRMALDYVGPQPIFDAPQDGMSFYWDAAASRFRVGISSGQVLIAVAQAQAAAAAAQQSAANAAGSEFNALTYKNIAGAQAGYAADSATQAAALVLAAQAGFIGFPSTAAYDFGSVADPTTYFNQDWGTV